MGSKSRRQFLITSGKFLVDTTALGSLTAYAGEHAHHGHSSGNGIEISASQKNTCATCQYWGGMRKVSKDRKLVTAQSMGWCNNPDSPNHQKLTGADHKMQKPGIWKKWAAL